MSIVLFYWFSSFSLTLSDNHDDGLDDEDDKVTL